MACGECCVNCYYNYNSRVMRTNLEISELRAVCTLAEEMNFRSAADRLSVSHSALSRMIKRIEDILGNRIFDRDTRNVELTPQGMVFLSCAQEALSNLENTMARYEDYVNYRRGRISIAGLPSVTGFILPDIVAEFSRTYPDIEVRILDSANQGVIEAVERGDADIGFTESLFASNTTLKFDFLFEDPFVAVTSESGAMSDCEVCNWADLLEFPFVTTVQDTSIRRLVDAVYIQLGKNFYPRFEVSQLVTAGALVSKGLGVSALPELALRAIGRKSLLKRQLTSPQVSRKMGLVMRRSADTQPSVISFLKLIKARFR